MNKKLYIKTYGCQMNEYDSDKISDIMRNFEGYTLTTTQGDADAIIFNTCSIREKAAEKLFSDLGRARKFKQKKPNLLIGVGGCVASQEGDVILRRAPYVDVIFGPQTLHRLPELIGKKQQSGKAQIDISFPEIEKFDNLPEARVTGASALVSIMEGCSKYCSYCVVPYTRGEEISRPFADIINEITRLTIQGVKEIHLLGQNVNAYRGCMPDGEIADFALLLECVHAIHGVERIRYTTSHPAEMNDRIINCYATLPKLVSHLHLPVQSGSDRILAAMKRGYSIAHYKEILNKIRGVRPQIVFSSDFIVGFPNETDSDFEETMQLIEEVGFDTSFSFIYSKRPGTPAAAIEDSIDADIKLDRLYRLQKRIDDLALNISKNMVGSIQKVLVEGVSKRNPNALSGRTENYKVVNFAGNPRLINQLVDVNIVAASTYSLSGELVTL